jgi:hypothetical protein
MKNESLEMINKLEVWSNQVMNDMELLRRQASRTFEVNQRPNSTIIKEDSQILEIKHDLNAIKH